LSILVFPRFDRHAGRSFVVVVVDAVEFDIHSAEIGARGKVRANCLANLDLGLLGGTRNAGKQ
jgi:hypothetical protein